MRQAVTTVVVVVWIQQPLHKYISFLFLLDSFLLHLYTYIYIYICVSVYHTYISSSPPLLPAAHGIKDRKNCLPLIVAKSYAHVLRGANVNIFSAVDFIH